MINDMKGLDPYDFVLYRFIHKANRIPAVIVDTNFIPTSPDFLNFDKNWKIGMRAFGITSVEENDSFADGFDQKIDDYGEATKKAFDSKHEYDVYNDKLVDTIGCKDYTALEADFKEFFPKSIKKENIFRLIGRAGSEIKNAMRGGKLELRSDEEIAENMAICDVCPHYNKKNSTCSLCGCKLSKGGKVMNKLRYKNLHCPINKW